MRDTIKTLLRELLNESINLNLSKQIRTKQLNLDVDVTLEGIFGKNVYRLYYDVNTGKQIYPTKKQPKLNFDVKIVDNLKRDVETTLSKLGYSLVDLDKNIAKNNKNNQTIKATKVLNSSDKIIFKKYTEYLSSITNVITGSEKLYVVVSRHSHDIASMSTKPNIESCESLEGYTDINQTLIGKDIDSGEGYGAYIWENIQSDSIVFYLIKEGDWNIQDPISRFSGIGICEFGNSHHFYGKYHNNFKNFVIGWVEYYKSKVLKKYTIKSDEDFFDKDVDELVKLLKISIDNNNNDDKEYIVRGLVKNNRYDVFYNLISTTNNKNTHAKVFDYQKVNYLINILNDIFGYKIINKFPDKIKEPIVNYLTTIIDDKTNKLKEFNYYFKNYESIKESYINDYQNIKDTKMLKVLLEQLKSNLLNVPYVYFSEVNEFSKLVEPDKLNEYKRELIFYNKNGGYNRLKSVKKYIYDSIINHFKNKKG